MILIMRHYTRLLIFFEILTYGEA
uniref:Uncharacterized protein n=1 Tax=mine drainage metagenome TaxID=410659 RepID=E6QHG7_9ZZZZ